MECAYRLSGGRDIEKLYPLMTALEMIHSSSLVHDDLPCMDNDELRRGKPSTWARFGIDMGTLAGDGLMIYAFETGLKSELPEDVRLRAIRILAEKSGIFGMIGGQTVDVELTGSIPDPDTLRFIYEKKTGALIEAALMMGAVCAGAGEHGDGEDLGDYAYADEDKHAVEQFVVGEAEAEAHGGVEYQAGDQRAQHNGQEHFEHYGYDAARAYAALGVYAREKLAPGQTDGLAQG